MKKVQLNAAKLQLDKSKVTNLTTGAMSKVVGGFGDVADNNGVVIVNDYAMALKWHFLNIHCSIAKSCNPQNCCAPADTYIG